MNYDSSLAVDGLPRRRRQWAIVTIGIAMFMTVADQTIANVALPTIGSNLHVDAASSVWIVNAYQVGVMLPLLPLAAAGDILGYKRVYLVGLALFSLASLGCALSPSLAVLTFMRVVQGVGAAGVMSVNMALVRFVHPVNRLGHGIGLNAVIIAVSAAAGPTIASSILTVAPWPWLFAVNVPFGIVAVVLGYYVLPDNPHATHAFDLISAALSAITFGTLIACIDAFVHPTPPLLIAAELMVMLVSGAVLTLRQLRVPSPLLPVDLLRLPIFALSIGTSIFSFIAQTMALIAIPFSLQQIGFSAVDTGLLMTPWPLATAIVAPISGKLSDRYSAGLLGLLGLLFFAAGLASLALIAPHTNPADVAWRMALAGAGFGLFQSPNNRTMQASAPRERSGGAGGMQSMARLLGQTTGAALVALTLQHLQPHGPGAALAISVGFAILGAVVSAIRLTDLPHAKN